MAFSQKTEAIGLYQRPKNSNILKAVRYITASCLLVASQLGHAAMANQTLQEADVRAAILFNLARYSHWPKDSKFAEANQAILCTQTTQIMQESLSDLAGKSLNGKTLSVKHIKPEDTNFDGCHIVYMSQDLISHDLDFNLLNGNNVLTIGDSQHLLKQGAGMSIQRQGKKIRFSINREAVIASGIKPSSKILNLAVDPG